MSNRIGYEVIGSASSSLLSAARNEESRRINKEVLLERLWWSSHLVYDESIAINSHKFVYIPDEGKHYRLIGDLRRNLEPKSLNTQAFMLLLEIQERWQKHMSDAQVISDNVFLAVTSLYRSPDLQDKISSTSYLASKGVSSHSAGAAIDFDPNGYFVGEARKSIQYKSDMFKRIYTDCLANILMELESEKACHVIWEKGIEIEFDNVIRYNAVYHVCVSPDFSRK